MHRNNPDPERGLSNVYEFRSVPHRSREGQLTPEEVAKLRQLIRDADKVFGNCPLAARALKI